MFRFSIFERISEFRPVIIPFLVLLRCFLSLEGFMLYIPAFGNFMVAFFIFWENCSHIISFFPVSWWLFCRYSRMPGQLMQTVITSLRARIEEGFPFKNDQTGLLVSFTFLTYFGRKGWGILCYLSFCTCMLMP